MSGHNERIHQELYSETKKIKSVSEKDRPRAEEESGQEKMHFEQASPLKLFKNSPEEEK